MSRCRKRVPAERCAMCVAIFAALFAASAVLGLEPGQLDYRETTLDNGLRVITLEDFSCPVVAVNLWYHVGSKDENPDRQGFAHMFEHMMFRGTDRLGPMGHFDHIREVGGQCNGYTSFDRTVYIERLPANQLELALWLEAERMSFLKIDQDAFDTERRVVEEERRLRMNRPYGTFEEDLLAGIFKVHPYRWTAIGKIPHLRAASVPELRAFWNRYYTPNNATLVVTGAVKHEEAQALANRYFGWIPRAPEPPRVTVREPLPTQRREIVFKQDIAPAPRVGIAYRTVSIKDEERPSFEVLMTILSNGESSRVHDRLVARKKLATGLDTNDLPLEQDGIYSVTAMLPSSDAKPDAALDVMEKQIDRIRSKRVTRRELTKAKNQLLRKSVVESLDVFSKAHLLGEAAVIEGDTARVNARLDDIRKITADDVLRAAKKYLDPSRALVFRIEQNSPSETGKTGNAENDAPITGLPETNPPPPGREGVARPADYPAAPPKKPLLDLDPTMPFRTHLLDNGLKVVVIENHEVPFVSVRLCLKAGTWTEAKPGSASLAMRMLRTITRKHPGLSLVNELETYGIQFNATAEMDSSWAEVNCVTEHLDRAGALLAEIVLLPVFGNQDFRTVRKREVTDIAVSAGSPRYLAERELRRRLYGQHPYARMLPGDIQEIESLNVRDVRQWWSTFARPDMACLYVAGDVDFDRAVRLAKDEFGSWKNQGPKPNVQLPSIPEPASTHIYLVDKPGDQAQIRIGQLAITRNHPHYPTSAVVTGYFGGSFGSRLNESLRVKKGLTYGVRGGYFAQRMAGQFDILTFTKNESAAEAVQVVLDEIKRLQAEPPTPIELDQTKAFITGSFVGDRETPDTIANDLWLIESEQLPEDYFKRFLDGVRKTDAAACQELARNTVDPSRLVVVVVGPAEALKAKLQTIAPVTVVASEPGPDA